MVGFFVVVQRFFVGAATHFVGIANAIAVGIRTKAVAGASTFREGASAGIEVQRCDVVVAGHGVETSCASAELTAAIVVGGLSIVVARLRECASLEHTNTTSAIRRICVVVVCQRLVAAQAAFPIACSTHHSVSVKVTCRRNRATCTGGVFTRPIVVQSERRNCKRRRRCTPRRDKTCNCKALAQGSCRRCRLCNPVLSCRTSRRNHKHRARKPWRSDRSCRQRESRTHHRCRDAGAVVDVRVGIVVGRSFIHAAVNLQFVANPIVVEVVDAIARAIIKHWWILTRFEV